MEKGNLLGPRLWSVLITTQPRIAPSRLVALGQGHRRERVGRVLLERRVAVGWTGHGLPEWRAEGERVAGSRPLRPHQTWGPGHSPPARGSRVPFGVRGFEVETRGLP